MADKVELNLRTGQPVDKKVNQSNLVKCPLCQAVLTRMKNKLVCKSCGKHESDIE